MCLMQSFSPQFDANCWLSMSLDWRFYRVHSHYNAALERNSNSHCGFIAFDTHRHAYAYILLIELNLDYSFTY